MSTQAVGEGNERGRRERVLQAASTQERHGGSRWVGVSTDYFEAGAAGAPGVPGLRTGLSAFVMFAGVLGNRLFVDRFVETTTG